MGLSTSALLPNKILIDHSETQVMPYGAHAPTVVFALPCNDHVTNDRPMERTKLRLGGRWIRARRPTKRYNNCEVIRYANVACVRDDCVLEAWGSTSFCPGLRLYIARLFYLWYRSVVLLVDGRRPNGECLTSKMHKATVGCDWASFLSVGR